MTTQFGFERANERTDVLDRLVDSGAANSYAHAYEILGIPVPDDDFSAEAILKRLGFSDEPNIVLNDEKIEKIFCGDCLNPACKGCSY